MNVLALIGQKGGSGKSTLATNLFVESWARGRTAVLIDLDPQASATRWGDRRGDGHIVSAHAVRLGKTLQAAEAEGAELAIIDTPARASDASLEAAKAAGLVIAPLRPFISDMETAVALHDLLELAGRPRAIVVINAAPIQGQRHDDARESAKLTGLEVCPVVLHQRAAYADAPLHGRGVREHEPKGAAAAEVAALYRFACKLLNPKTLKPSEEVHP